MANLSRRTVLKNVAVAVAAAATLPANGADAPTRPAAAADASRLKLRPFEHRDVKLTGGPLKAQYDYALALLLGLPDDNILKVYRAKAGLPAPGADMGGWYDAAGFGPGHGLGQWTSALSRFAAAGSGDAKAKVKRLVDGFAATLAQGPPFYEFRFPCYVYDKHVGGLTDAFRYAGVESARDVLKLATDRAAPFLPEKALTHEEMLARPHKDHTYTLDESYTIAENQFVAYQVFGDERHLALGKRFLHDEPYFDKLARGEPAIVGRHAYSHVNALGSAAMAYLVLGTEKHRAAIVNAWDMIERDQRFASGGWGPKEVFVEPGKGKLFESLSTTRNHFETPCGSYATIKLARYLSQFTGDSRYGDGLERVLYNGILAAKRLQPDGTSFYYSDYQAGARKVFHPDKWPCCAGSYPLVIADYPVNIYFHDGRDVYVNLYTPSELAWARAVELGGGGVKLVQETEYPEAGQVSIRVEPGAPVEFAVKLRIPAWAGEGTSATVNGEPTPAAPRAGEYFAIQRTWKPGDRIVLTIPLTPRAEPIDAQHPDVVAVMRGSVLQVGVGDRLALERLDPPTANYSIRFVPFYKIGDEVYTTYFTRG